MIRHDAIGVDEEGFTGGVRTQRIYEPGGDRGIEGEVAALFKVQSGEADCVSKISVVGKADVFSGKRGGHW